MPQLRFQPWFPPISVSREIFPILSDSQWVLGKAETPYSVSLQQLLIRGGLLLEMEVLLWTTKQETF